MSRLKSISPALLAVEFVSITFAVFLGFLLTEWRTSRGNAELAEGALRAIATEATFNHEQMAYRVGYFRDMNAQFDSLRSVGREISISDLNGWSGAAPPLVRRSAYDAATATGALSYVEFDVANDVATMYAMQDYLETFISAVMQQLMDPEAVTPESVEYIFQVFIDLSPEIFNVYEQVGSAHLQPHGYRSPTVTP